MQRKPSSGIKKILSGFTKGETRRAKTFFSLVNFEILVLFQTCGEKKSEIRI